MTAHPSIFAKWLNMIGLGGKSEHDESLLSAGARDGALTMSEEPTAEEVERVVEDKFDPDLKDR